MEFINGQMEGFTREIGKMENNMEKENMYYQMVHKEKDYGKMEKGLCGSIKKFKKIKNILKI